MGDRLSRQTVRCHALVLVVLVLACGEVARDSSAGVGPRGGTQSPPSAAVPGPVAPDRGGGPDQPSRVEAFYDVHGDTLSTPDHGHIPLGRGHGSVQSRTRIRVSPLRRWVIVETNRGACGAGSDHVVDLVELDARTVRRISEGAGWVLAVFQGEDARVEPRRCD
ncbi:MAG: hypothetical protein IT379_05030 [Deltaproteobacteria bacterium]|nr:hypothetical protein [Deltaproteobacteria bacterium]